MDDRALRAELQSWATDDIVPSPLQDLLRRAAAALGLAEQQVADARAEAREIERRYQTFHRWEGM